MLSITSENDRWAIIATALATALLAIFTAQLYGASVAQFRAASRPVLVDVKPYAPPPPDLSGRETAPNRFMYDIHFGDGHWERGWDARRPFVTAEAGDVLRASIVLRNVGTGLALIALDDRAVRFVHDKGKMSAVPEVRYKRIPPGETTRVNVVGGPLDEPYRGDVQIAVPYTDISGESKEEAIVTLMRVRTEAWTAVDGFAWKVSNISYSSDGLTHLQRR